MTINQVGQMLELAKSSNLHAVVYGNEGVGKTSFCKHKFPNAMIILASELNDNNLLFLKSAFETNSVIIIENLTHIHLNFLLPILNNRTILGRSLNNFFIITAREKIDIPNSLPIPFTPPSSSAWLEWAKNNKIHPSIIEALNYKDLLEIHKPRDLEALSKVLHNGVSSELMEPVLKSFLGDDSDTIEFLKSLELGNERTTLESGQTTNSEPHVNTLNRFDIQSSFYGKKNKNNNLKDEDTYEHLKVLLEEEESWNELSDLLERKDIQAIIDSKLRKLI